MTVHEHPAVKVDRIHNLWYSIAEAMAAQDVTKERGHAEFYISVKRVLDEDSSWREATSVELKR